jgi:hypothetical protein
MTIHRLDNLTLLLLTVITVVLVPLSYSVFIPTLEQIHAFARCPNGTHKSPSGVCEQVVPHEGLSRCPNGFHRSPSAICEAVNGNSNPETNHINNAAGSNSKVVETPSSYSTSSLAGQCDQTLWNHVYSPARLQIVDQCKTVSGTIESVSVEQDGDFHIRLRVDPQFASMIKSANVNGQFGDLVLEPICENPVTQPDAIAACANFHQNINIPQVGTHVTVTGSYVHDLGHGGWAEIHPVTSIK